MLKVKKSLKENQSQLDAAQATIHKAAGDNFELQVDAMAFAKDERTPEGDKGGLGGYLYERIAYGVSEDLAELCKDEDGKEALLETINKNVVKIVPAKEDQTVKHSYDIEDGQLMIYVQPKMLGYLWDSGSLQGWLENKL